MNSFSIFCDSVHEDLSFADDVRYIQILKFMTYPMTSEIIIFLKCPLHIFFYLFIEGNLDY